MKQSLSSRNHFGDSLVSTDPGEDPKLREVRAPMVRCLRRDQDCSGKVERPTDSLAGKRPVNNPTLVSFMTVQVYLSFDRCMHVI